MSKLRGFFYPRSATGRASLIPPPPWHYSGDLLTIEYRTDPAAVAELLPAPLEPAAEDPGAVALIWADWQSCGESGQELLDPVRSQYRECFAVVRCRFEGRIYSRCVYIWVDKDFALLRGIHQGYPKKLGAIHMTRPHPYGPAPRLAEGARLGATLAAANRRLFAIRDMIKAFRSLYARYKGEVTAEVTVAETLSDKYRDTLTAALKSVTGKDVQVDVKVDPAIIGGLIVKLGSRMVDASLKTRLNSIKHAMKEVS